MSSRKKVTAWLSTILFVVGTAGFVWTCSRKHDEKKERERSFPQTDVIEDKSSPYDSIVHYTEDSAVFFKDGKVVGFTRRGD